MDIIFIDDRVFSQWKQDRVNGTLGQMKTPTPTQPPTTVTTTATNAGPATTSIFGSDPAATWALMGRALGQSISTAMKPIADATTTAAKRKEAEKEKGKTYDLYEIHLLMGWSGVENVKDLQIIWREF